MDAGRDQKHPINLRLLRPLRGQSGRVVVPKNAIVSAQVVPTEEGARVVADSLVVRGRQVPIKAASKTIPGREVTQSSRTQEAAQKQQVFGKLGQSVAGAVKGGDSDSQLIGGLAGSALGLVSGMASPDEVKLVQIPKGSTFLLTLKEPVEIAAQAGNRERARAASDTDRDRRSNQKRPLQ